MLPKNYFICVEYRLRVCQQICYLFQNPSNIVTETADAKVKIGVSESDDKKILLVIADVNFVALNFIFLQFLIGGSLL